LGVAKHSDWEPKAPKLSIKKALEMLPKP